MNNEFFKKLLVTFNVESKDRLNRIFDTLIALENNQNPSTIAGQIEIVFREVHSLKSSARAVNFKKVEELCQTLEDVLAVWKQKAIIPTSEQLDIVHRTADTILKLIQDPQAVQTDNVQQESEQTDAQQNTIINLKNDIKKINNVASEENVSEKNISGKNAPEKKAIHYEKLRSSEKQKTNLKSPASDKTTSSEKSTFPPSKNLANDSLDTIRIASSKLDSLFVQAEEMLSIKLSLVKNIESLAELNDHLRVSQKVLGSIHQEKSLLKKIAKDTNGLSDISSSEADRISNFLEWNEQLINEMVFNLNKISHNLNRNLHVFSNQLDGLLEDTKKILMWPFSTLLQTFPKIVRDLSRTLEKDINFTMEGGEIEIDKRILEEIKDVLLHIIRNAIDHGIEKPNVRKQLNKNPVGNLSLTVQQISGNEILLTITDDGSGIDLDAVKKSAIKLGVISSSDAQNMSDESALDLIYQSGVSSSPILTDLSGRGLGMAIIREKIEKISGNISITTEANKGTVIKIKLPLMIATFKGTLIKISEQLFIIPTANLERTFRIRPENINTVENRDSIIYNGKTVSLVWLNDMLSIPRRKKTNNEYLSVVLITGSEKKVAFVVDEILHEQEIIVKNFRKPLSRIRNIAAASILETGKPVGILNTSDLLHSIKTDIYHAGITTDGQETKEIKHVLLVEDSITTRMVLKNIFELSGFQVTACADGLEAWSTVKNHNFSIVVSDVDMPRMNGFELTEKIRSDNTLSYLPVVLVTARESNEDRTRGIDVGANAYITKSNFEGSALVDVVQRLMI